MYRKIFKFKRLIAIHLLVIFVFEIVAPSTVQAHVPTVGIFDYAGYSQGQGHSVSKASGALSYSIPVTSIPEYPLSITYTSGQNPMQDAGAFGLGFSSFSGAITRTVNGVPDDVNKAARYTFFENQSLRELGNIVNTNLSVPIPKANIVLSAGSTYGGGFNNYTGYYRIFGASAGASLIGVPVQLRAGLTLDSRADGATYNFGISGSLPLGDHMQIGGGLSVSKMVDGKSKAEIGEYLSGTVAPSLGGGALRLYNTGNLLGNNEFSLSSSTPGTGLYLPSLNSFYPDADSEGFVRKLSIGISLDKIDISASVDWIRIAKDATFGRGIFKKQLLGSYYLNNLNRRDANLIPDFTIEGEQLISESVSYMQKDQFNLKAKGISGSFEIVQPEAGIFSRNAITQKSRFRERGGLFKHKVKYSNEGQYPWLGTGNIQVQKNQDILNGLVGRNAVINKAKGGEELDEVYFRQNEQVSFTEDYDDFSSNPYFRMRGDYSGDYRLLPSVSEHDKPLQMVFNRIPGNTEANRFYWGESPEIGYPDIGNKRAVEAWEQELNQGAQQRSTNIREITVGEYLSEFDNVSASSLNGSIYSFYQVEQNRYDLSIANYASAEGEGVLSTKTTREHLQGLLSQEMVENEVETPEECYFNDLIAGFEVTATNGTKYYFTLPVFSYDEQFVGVKGDGFTPPVIKDNAYWTTSDYKRGAKREFNSFYYPSAWLLTAIVQPDYIDKDNVLGPSDGDLGNWVRFNYMLGQSQYNWRTPLIGMGHAVGAVHDMEDDYYSASGGSKEVYYLASVESPDYESVYTYAPREDGYGAKNKMVNGVAWNSFGAENYKTGTNSNDISNYLDNTQNLFCVTDITLYHKKDPSFFGKVFRRFDKLSSRDRVPISGTKFRYDYSCWTGVLSNRNYGNNVPISGELTESVSYFYNKEYNPNVGTGHLTLREVVPYSYNEQGEKHDYPSTELFYEDNEHDGFNFTPDEREVLNEKLDHWGNVNLYAGTSGEVNTSRNFYNNYTQVSKELADRSANIYQLQKVLTPDGGTKRFDYEAGSYISVQGVASNVMRSVKGISASGNSLTLEVDISDIHSYYEELNGLLEPTDLGLLPEPTLENVYRNIIAVDVEKPSYHKGVYAEVAFYRNSIQKTEIENVSASSVGRSLGLAVFGDDTLKIQSFGDIDPIAKTQEITLVSSGSDDVRTPVYRLFENFIYTVSEEYAAAKSGFNQPKVEVSLPPKSVGKREALRIMKNQLKRLVNGDPGAEDKLQSQYGTLTGEARCTNSNIYNGLSFLRTPCFLGKYTGSRVSAITISSNFQMATGNNVQDDNIVTNYFYDTHENGSGFSTGVATNEPGFGKNLAFSLADVKGKGFFTAPRIIYGKVTEQRWIPSASEDNLDSKVYRPGGKMVAEYLTPDKPGYRFTDNFRTHQQNAMPHRVLTKLYYKKVTGYVKRQFSLRKKSKRKRRRKRKRIGMDYANGKATTTKLHRYIDLSDFLGKELSNTVYDTHGNIVSRTETHYNNPSELVAVVSQNNDFEIAANLRPGALEQLWGEMAKRKISSGDVKRKNSKLITSTDFVLTYTDYLYVPPVVDKIVTMQDGIQRITEHKKYDKYTLNPLETTSSIGDITYHSRSRPAYWNNPEMGVLALRTGRENQLTAKDFSVRYKHSISDQNVLSAQFVDYGKWRFNGGNSWEVINDLHLRNRGIGSSYIMTLEPLDYQSEFDQSRINKGNFRYPSSISRPYKSYQLLGAVTADGFIEDFENKSDLDNLHKDWKLISEVRKYNHKGAVVESKDRQDNISSTRFYPSTGAAAFAASQAPYDLTVFNSGEFADLSELPPYRSNPEGSEFGLIDAQMLQRCSDNSTDELFTLGLSNFGGFLGTYNAHVLSFSPQQTLAEEVVVCKLRVRLNDYNKVVNVVLTPSNQLLMVADDGKPFDFYLSATRANQTVEALFMVDFDVDLLEVYQPTIVDVMLYQNQTLKGEYEDCVAGEKQVQFDLNQPCTPDVHTGKGAFLLPANSRGCGFAIPAESLATNSEYRGKQSIWVWLKTDDASDIKAVASIISHDALSEKDFSEEVILEEVQYEPTKVKAGKWSLFKANFNLKVSAEYLNNNNRVVLYLHNLSNEAVYVDDYLAKPTAAAVSATIYDHRLSRPIGTVMPDHFTTKIVYDDLGVPTITLTEVEGQNQGLKVTGKNFYGFQKEIE